MAKKPPLHDGIRARALAETPAATVSYQAHRYALENFLRRAGPRYRYLMSVVQATAFYADKQGKGVRCSFETLASQLGMDRDSVRRQVRKLERLDWLRCVSKSAGPTPSTYEIAPMGAKREATYPLTSEGVNPHRSSCQPPHPAQQTPSGAAADPRTGEGESVSESGKNQFRNQRAVTASVGRAMSARDSQKQAAERRAPWIFERNRLATEGLTAEEINARTGPDPAGDVAVSDQRPNTSQGG